MPERRNESSAACTPADQWRGLYAGRPDEQKMVNSEALAKMLADLDEATVALQTCLYLLHEAVYISNPEYPEVDAALALYERLVGA